MKDLDRQVFDRDLLSHVQAFLHAVLFPSVRLLAVREISTINEMYQKWDPGRCTQVLWDSGAMVGISIAGGIVHCGGFNI